MPKMKSNSGALKRFKRRASGEFKRGQANKSHILTKMTTKRKRQLRNGEAVSAADAAAVRKMIPYS